MIPCQTSLKLVFIIYMQLIMVFPKKTLRKKLDFLRHIQFNSCEKFLIDSVWFSLVNLF